MAKAVSTLVDAGEQTQEKMAELLEAVAVEKYLRVVPLQEIQENDYNLNISRYIDTSEPEEIVDLDNVLKALSATEIELDKTESDIKKMLGEVGLTI